LVTIGFLSLAGVLPLGHAGADTIHRAHYMPVCGKVPADEARCHAIVVVPETGQEVPNAAAPPGYHPGDLRAAYNLTTAAATAGGSQTVAVIDAYDDPSAEGDLAVYRATFGLPPCTSINGCFHKVNERGGTAYPRPDAQWA
jgi:hypothetical protein